MSGYGINLAYNDEKGPSDHVNLEVGTFKNGRLHGVGYRCKLVFQYKIIERHANAKLSYRIYKDKISLESQYGLFVDGKPVNTKSIDIKNAAVGSDYWEQQLIKGISYKNKSNPSEVRIMTYTEQLANIKAGDKLYVTDLERILKIKEVNTVTGDIKTETDDPKILAEFTKDSPGKLYVNRNVNSIFNQSCPTTVKIPHYKKVSKFAYFVPSKTTTNSYIVTGAYYDKKVTTTTTIPSQEVYKDVDELDYYTTETCQICGGTGKLQISKMQNAYLEIKF